MQPQQEELRRLFQEWLFGACGVVSVAPSDQDLCGGLGGCARTYEYCCCLSAGPQITVVCLLSRSTKEH